MRKYTFIISLLVSFTALPQGFYLGEDVSFQFDSLFTLNGDAHLNGAFYNGRVDGNGIIIDPGRFITRGNVDFVENEDIGNVSFLGDQDQTVTGDTLIASGLIVNKGSSTLFLNANLFQVNGDAEIISGVVQSPEIEDFIVDGSVTGGGDDGYIEGVSVQVSQGQPMNFPMGINGFYNGFEIEGVPDGEVIAVEINVPSPGDLQPDSITDILGIAEEVQWTLVSEEEIDILVTVDFNGVELSTGSVINGQEINTTNYAPVIVKKSPGDSLFRAIGTEEIVLEGPNGITNGNLVSNDFVRIGPEPTLFALALIPVITESVLYIPEAFSPFADFVENRTFKPFFGLTDQAEITTVTFEVFDRFNNTIYSFNGSGQDLENIGWDGKLPSGQIADEGVYAYRLSYTLVGGTFRGETANPKTGTFLLVNR